MDAARTMSASKVPTDDARIRTSPKLTPPSGKRLGNGFCSAPHSQVAIAWKSTNMPSVTTTVASTGAARSGRIKARNVKIPSTKEPDSPIAMESHKGRPH